MSRGDRRWLHVALVASAVLHAGVIAGVWATASRAEPLPPLRVYAVDIVSPPPREQGDWTPEPATDPQPVAEPEPPVDRAPEPKPLQPDPAPAPSPTQAPEPSEPKRATTEPKPEAPKPTPDEPASARKPEERPPVRDEPTPAPERDRPAPSTGARPDASSPGGEDLNVRTEGADFVDPAYLANIQRQINRYFRRPPGARTEEAEVRFWINRNGSVSDIQVVRSTGGFAFRAAAMEAVEQAGLNRAFGLLPEAYTADRLLISFYFRPAR